jgi:DNA-binding transcriptional MerR regulator
MPIKTGFQFIRYCRGLDMSLDEVRILLDFKDRPPEDCTDVNALIEEHIDHVTTRIKSCARLKSNSRPALPVPRGTACDECGILNELFAASSRRGVYASEPTHVRGAPEKEPAGSPPRWLRRQ